MSHDDKRISHAYSKGLTLAMIEVISPSGYISVVNHGSTSDKGLFTQVLVDHLRFYPYNEGLGLRHPWLPIYFYGIRTMYSDEQVPRHVNLAERFGKRWWHNVSDMLIPQLQLKTSNEVKGIAFLQHATTLFVNAFSEQTQIGSEVIFEGHKRVLSVHFKENPFAPEGELFPILPGIARGFFLWLLESRKEQLDGISFCIEEQRSNTQSSVRIDPLPEANP